MDKIILALPKGRILKDLELFFRDRDIIADPELFDDSSRKLTFKCNIENIEIIKVRSFDVATIVKFGGADVGICGKDVIEEFPSDQYYPVIDLKIGQCRLSLAKSNSHDVKNFDDKITIATKYVNITQNYFEKLGMQPEIIKLNGALEIAPKIGLSNYIIDLVSSGKTLQENNLQEITKILEVNSFLIVNRTSLKTKNFVLNNLIKLFDVK